mmetsp:Transcript_59792/g.142333  ORF Transcript_59792/g.142333 Transcript_59792/m.142333 type:complete len:1456 (+) Transcript_59792:146-4513(+)
MVHLEFLVPCLTLSLVLTAAVAEFVSDVAPDSSASCQADSHNATPTCMASSKAVPLQDVYRSPLLEEYDPQAAKTMAELHFSFVVTSGLLVIGIVVGYFVALHPDCPDGSRPPFWRWATGTTFLPHFRRRKESKENVFMPEHYPEGPYRAELNPEMMVTWVEEKVSSGASLEGLFWRTMAPAYCATHIFAAAERFLSIYAASTFGPCVLVWFELPAEYCPYFFLEFPLASAFAWMAGKACSVVQEQLITRAAMPLVQGMFFAVAKATQNMSLEEAVNTNGAEKQAVAQQTGGIAIAAGTNPLRRSLVDVATFVWCLWKLYETWGFFCVSLGLLAICLGGFVEAQASKIAVRMELRRLDLQKQRMALIDVVTNNLKVLQQSAWLERTARPLAALAEELHQTMLRASLVGGIGGAITSHLNTILLAVTYIWVVKMRGEHVSLVKVMQSAVYLDEALKAAAAFINFKTHMKFCRVRLQAIQEAIQLKSKRQDFATGLVKVQGATFAWPVKGSSRKPVLHEIDFAPKKGELVLVSGENGSGKTSFLLSLLGELLLTEGDLTVPSGVVGWQQQVPVLVSGTIEENVRFRAPMAAGTHEHVMQALNAVHLVDDMLDQSSALNANLQDTDVGIGGNQLSGGQRARTMLARACYQALEGAETMILDDPVTQVDNHMLMDVWEDAVLRIMGGCTRIVAVNSQLIFRLASTADRIVLLKEGRVVYDGCPAPSSPQAIAAIRDALGKWAYDLGDTGDKEVRPRSPSPMSRRLSTPKSDSYEEKMERISALSSEKASEEEANSEKPVRDLVQLVRDSDALQKLVWEEGSQDSHTLAEDAMLPASSGSQTSTPTAGEQKTLIKIPQADWHQLRKLLQLLDRQAGDAAAMQMPLEISQVLLKNARDLMLLPVVSLMYFVNSCKPAAVTRAMRRWTSDTEPSNQTSHLMELLFLSIGSFVIFLVAEYLSATMRAGMISKGIKRFHGALQKVGQHYFWWQPKVGLENMHFCRHTDASQFVQIVAVPATMLQTLVYMLYTLTKAGTSVAVVLMCQVPFRYKIAELGQWAGQADFVQRHLIVGAYEGVTTFFDHMVAVRACKAQDYRRSLFHRNVLAGVFCQYWCSQSSFLKLFLEQLVVMAGGVCIIFMLHRLKQAGEDPDALNLLLMSITGFGGCLESLTWGVTSFVQAVHAYRKYSMFIETDLLEDSNGQPSQTSWPSKGKIVFEDVTFRYRPHAPPALLGCSFVIEPGEKIGVVGRPGSGKSTLVCVLARLSPLAGVPPFSGGRVLIDDIDISTVRLADLRSAIGVVPQDCTLLPGSLKANVGEEFSDAEVLMALEHVGLDVRRLTHKEKLPDAFATPLSSVGLSGGERQLLVAARALVKRPKVLILDECTASLSMDQADMLLASILRHYPDTTILSIAHRLRFVLDSDRIMVMAAGQLIACGSKSELLQDEAGYFATNLRHEQQEDPS